MTENPTSAYTPSEVSPPGETLRELLEEKGLSQAELATRMGRPRKTISEIVTGKAAITHETALQLELVTGIPAQFWNSRERAYRSYLAKLEEQERLAAEYSWCKRFPIREMIRLGWIRKLEDKAQQVHDLLSFLGVVSSSQWEELYADYAVAFRRSKTFTPDKYALGAWLRRGAEESRLISTSAFDQKRFAEALAGARKLTREPDPAVFIPSLQTSCASTGVAVVLVPELPGCRASGATRWVAADKALIQLSVRHKTNDHLWFTFFHEAAHILLHGRRLIFIEANGGTESKEELEANEWAGNFLIPKGSYGQIADLDPESITDELLESFSEQIGVAAGIVVGRLQHDGRLGHHQFNGHKIRYEWKEVCADVDG